MIERSAASVKRVESEPADARYCYRMRDLCEITGLPRQAIHFYVKEGILAPGRKTGRNMAWYSEQHVQRLRLIKKLQQERFLPLRAIKALLDGQSNVDFSVEQRRFLQSVRARFGHDTQPGETELGQTEIGQILFGTESEKLLDVDVVIARTCIHKSDLERAIGIGLVRSVQEEEQARIPESDLWIIESIAELRAIGFDEKLGFSVDDIAVYEEAMSSLFRNELKLLSSRLSGLPPEQVASMIERFLPVIHRFLVRYHANQVRNFLDTVT